MFRSLLLIGLALGATQLPATAWADPTGANPAGASSDAERDKKINMYLKSSVQLEVDAFTGLITGMKTANEKTGKKPSDAAKAAHEKGQALYKEAKGLSDAGDYKNAYLKLREAWAAHKPANKEFMDGAPKDVLEGIASKLLGMLKERIQTLDEHVNKAPEDAKASFKKAKESYEAAKTLNGEGKQGEAIAKADDAIEALHQTLVTTWKIAG